MATKGDPTIVGHRVRTGNDCPMGGWDWLAGTVLVVSTTATVEVLLFLDDWTVVMASLVGAIRRSGFG